jgi:hypothetical protein
MRRILVLSLLVVFLVVVSGAQGNGQTTRKKLQRAPAMEAEAEAPDCPDTIADCPNQGCGRTPISN